MIDLTDAAGGWRCTTPEVDGLAEAEVRDRIADGRVNGVAPSTTRPTAAIIKANLFTRFNALFVAMFVAIASVHQFKDAVFIWVVVLNAGVGIVQELRARRTLDALTLVTAPQVRVRRGGIERVVEPSAVVLDDIILIERGDQLAVDAMVIDTRGLELDESMLTGESDTIDKKVGDRVLSGSVVVAGSGTVRASAVGTAAYAHTLTEQARRFGLARSELRAGIDQILRLVTWVAIPTALLLLWSQLRANETATSAIAGTVAGVVAMVPEGLILLTSVAFAAGVVRLGKHSVLTRELAAIEGLARVDVLCIDKTGTLTLPGMRLVDVVELDHLAASVGRPTTAEALAALAGLESRPNASLAAIATAYPNAPGWTVEKVVPFSSERKWSGATFLDRGTWVLGAPEFVLRDESDESRAALVEAAVRAGSGRRVLLLALSDEPLATADSLPPTLRGVAFVELAEQIKPNVEQTIAFFADQGVAVKVVSGDNPVTVAAVATQAGVPDGDRALDARSLPVDLDELGAVLDATSVLGRVTPEQKRRVVEALQRQGHVVAMTGDGVNDLLALKDADVGIAMGGGSAATRSVAQFVLVDDNFASLPHVIAEGRRVIANIERVANLFVAKTVYALILALLTGVAGLPFPFLPRQLSIVGTLTIGLPSFILALEPNASLARKGYVNRVLRFALPAGIVAAAATFAAYADARSDNATLAQARTTSTIVLFIVAMWILSLPVRPLTARRRTLIAAIAATFTLLLALPGSRNYLELVSPPRVTWLTGAPVIVAACVLLEVGERASKSTRWSERRRPIIPSGP